MNRPECRFASELPAYALGSLDPAAEAEVEAHLEGCTRCAEELRWLAPAVETVPESVEQLAPPPALRRRLMKVVRAEAESQAQPTWRDRRLRIGRFAFGPATALVCALLVAQITVAVLVGHGSRDADSGRIVAVAAGPPGSTAKLEIGGGQATFVAQRVPRLLRGTVYQVWVRRNNVVRPSSTFEPNSDGSAAAAVPGAAKGASQVMVTREPRTGLRPTKPSSPPIYTATLGD